MDAHGTDMRDDEGGDAYIPFDSPTQSMIATLDQAPKATLPEALATPFGLFSMLPVEIRLQIYTLLLTSRAPATWPASMTYGRRSGISTAILYLSRTITAEAKPILYQSAPHWISIHTTPLTSLSTLLHRNDHKCPQCLWNGSVEICHTPPPQALALIPTLHIHLQYTTWNRGDAEVGVRDPSKLLSETSKLLTHLFNARAVRRLHVELLNTNQRKRGPKTVRLPAVVECMRHVLLFFTCLPMFVEVSIGGFDSIQWIDMFDELISRQEHEEGCGRPEGWCQVPWAAAAVWEEIEKPTSSIATSWG